MLFGNSNPPSTPENQQESWSSWLDRAERETWQMELLLSGFVILLLAQAKEPLDKWLEVLYNYAGTNNTAEVFALGANVFLPSAWLVLFSSLIFGVVLRALWISAIGLRSVSGEIDMTQLKLAPKFKGFLERRVPSFDTYIGRLENVCSIVFGLTFLTVFALIGAALLILTFMFLMNLITLILQQFYEEIDDAFGVVLFFAFSLIFIFSTIVVVYMIDFFSGSLLKQSKTFSKFYYPIYRVLGWLTLARIYRPLYYNFVDNRVGRYGILAIIPYGIILLVVFQFNNSSFSDLLPKQDNYAFGQVNYYADTHDGVVMSGPMIDSKIISGDLMQLQLPLGGKYYKILDKVCEEESKSFDKLIYVAVEDKERYARYTNFLVCVTQAYKCVIDATQVDFPTGIIVENAVNKETQLLTTLDVSYLAPGAHVLRVLPNWPDEKRPQKYAVTIPFIKQ